jgi:asparagine N-glycosylation enzyme membrane subunit Stt3
VLRGLGIGEVFPGDGLVDLDVADAAYHARRALFSFVNFPAVLVWDSYIAHPDGAAVPMPPLYDWALAAVARAFGASVSGFERVAAWASPTLAALSVLPVYAVGRIVAGHGLGLGAALVFAVLPTSVRTSGLGDADHHAAVALLGVTFLLLSLELVRREAHAGRGLGLTLAMMLVRTALLLSWSGSLLYLVLGESTLLLLALLEGRRAMLWAQAAGALGAALLVVPWLWATGSVPGDAFSTTNLSWFHVAFLAGVSFVCAGLELLARLVPGAGLARRVVLAAGVSMLAGGALLLAFPQLREALAPALAFLSKGDSWGLRNLEQQPIFFGHPATGESPFAVAQRHYGLLAGAIPLVPLALLAGARDPARRPIAVCLACWSLVLGVLAVAQVRFGSDFAPVGSVGFAVLLGAAGRVLARIVPRASVAVAATLLGAALLWPGVAATCRPKLSRTIDWAGGSAPGEGARRLTSSQSLAHFARAIRAATPETSGYFDALRRPEYGILCQPSQGHALHYFARRATSSNNFGPYLDLEKYRAVRRFYRTGAESEAVAIAERLGARYVMSFAREGAQAAFFADRLHRWDGVGPGEERVERMRLILEGPAGGLPRRSAYPSGEVTRGTIPYKLFEVVEGAVFEARAAPGTEMLAQLPIVTSLGRRFRYRASARADGEGRVRLRVPYATESTQPTRSVGSYRVRLGDAALSVSVTEADVREGAVIAVGGSAAAS